MAENLGEAKGYVTLDISNFQNNIKILNNLATAVENTLTKLEAMSQQLNNSVSQSFNAVSTAARNLDNNLSGAGTALNNSVSQISNSTQNLATNTAESASSVTALQSVTQQLVGTVQALGVAIQQMTSSAQQVSSSTDQMQVAVTRVSTGFNTAGTAAEEFAQRLQETRTHLGNTEQQSQKTTTAVKAMESAFKSALSGLKKLFVAVGAAFTGAVTASAAIGSSFEASMSQVASTMGITVEEIQNGSEAYEALSNSAQEWGAKTKFSATEAAEALNYLALAGYTVEEATNTLPKVLNLAAAGGMELARASDMVTDSAAALGLGIDEIDKLIDQMAVTSQKSNTNVAQLGEGILTVGGTAKILSGGITELNTALGILADNGIKGAEGGTALRQIILNLTTPTDKAAKKMAELGISVFDAQDNIRGLNEVFRDLNETLKYASDQKRMDALGTIFDARQLKSATALMANYGERWDELSGYIDASAGSADGMAKTLNNNLKGALEEMSSAAEGVAIRVYEVFKEPLTNAIKQATSAINQLEEAIQDPKFQASLKSIADTTADLVENVLTALATTILPALTHAISFLIDNFGALIAAFGTFAVAVVAYNASMLAAAAKTAILTLAQESLTVAMLANPFTAVAAALAALVAGIGIAINKYNEQTEAIRAQHPEYQESIDLINEQKQALADLTQNTDNLVQAEQEKAEQVKVLVERLNNYVDSSGRVVSNETAVKEIIEEINSIYPDFIQYTNEQIQNYDTLNQKLQTTTELMRLQALQQGNMELYQEAAKIYAEAAAKQDQLAENTKKATQEYEDAVTALTEHDAEASLSPSWWKKNTELEQTLIVAKENLELAKQAEEENKTVTEQSLETMKQYEDQMAQAESNIIKAKLDAGQEVEGIYQTEAEARTAIAKQQGEKQAEELKQIYEKQAEEEQRIQDEMYSKLDEIDRKYNTHKITDEGDYYEQRLKVLEEYQDRESEEWWKLYDKDEKKLKTYNEKKQKEQEQQNKEWLQQQKEAAKDEIHQLDVALASEELTQSEYYDRLELLLTRWKDKGIDLWNEYDTKIIEGRKQLSKETEKADKKAAEASFKTWSETIDNTIGKYKDKATEISKNQAKLESDLNNYAKLYVKTAKTIRDKSTLKTTTQEVMEVSSKSLKEQIKALETYKKNLETLKEKGASDELINEIVGMGVEEGSQFAAELSKKGEKEVAAYGKLYSDLQKSNKEFSEKFYKTQLDDLQTDFIDEMKNKFKNLPADFTLVGEDTVSGFIQGLEKEQSNATGVMETLMGNVVDMAKSALDIHSPSKEFEKIGEYTVQGQIDGVTNKSQDLLDAYTQLGKSSIQSMLDGMKSSWSEVSNWLTSSLRAFYQAFAQQEMASILPTGMLTSPNGAAVQMGYLPSYTQPQQSLTQEDITNAIKAAQPDGDVVLKVDKTTFGQIARDSLNSLAKDSGNLGIQN